MNKEVFKTQSPQKSSDPIQTRKKAKTLENLTKPNAKEIQVSSLDENSNHLKMVLEKLNLALDTIHLLVQEVGDLKSELKEVKDLIQNVEESQVKERSGESSPQSQSSTIGSFNSLIRRNMAPDELKGPFPKYEPTDRILPRPSTKEMSDSIGGKAHSLQFTSSLYVRLIEQVLGPVTDTGFDYKAMVKEAILITKAIVSEVKEENQIDPNLRWSLVNPTIKLDAYRRLEIATEHLLPLKICTEFWGAHILLSNFWLRRTTAASTGKIRKKPPTAGESNNNVHKQRKKPNAFSIPFLITHPQK